MKKAVSYVKKILLLFAVFVCMFQLCSCLSLSDRMIQEKEAERWRNQAELNAVDYLEDKYGFTADVVSSQSDRGNSFYGTLYSERTLVIMNYQGEEIHVLVSGGGPYNGYGQDDYQKDEICQAFVDFVIETFKTNPNDLEFVAGVSDFYLHNGQQLKYMFFEYYDGTNLEEVIGGEYDDIRGAAKFVGNVDIDTLIDECDNTLWNNPNMNYIISTHETEDLMNASILYDQYNQYLDKQLFMYLPYLSDGIYIEDGDITKCDISIGQCGDIYYYCEDLDISEYSVSEEVDTYNASLWNGHGAIKSTAPSEVAYYVSGSDFERHSEIYIYYPADKMPSVPPEYESCPMRMGRAWYNDNYGEISYSFIDQEINEEFYIFISNVNDGSSYRLLYDQSY